MIGSYDQPDFAEELGGLFMRKLSRAVVTLAAACAVAVQPGAAFAAPAQASWPLPGYGPGNTGVNPNERAITPKTVNDLAYRWSVVAPVVRAGCVPQTPPVVAGGRMFLGDEGGIGGYDAVTGRRVWHRAMPVGMSNPEFLLAGATLLGVYNTCGSVSDPNGVLVAYDWSTGAVRWQADRDAPMWNAAVENGVVVVGGGDAASDAVTAYRVGDGRKVWEKDDMALGAEVSAQGRLLLTKVGQAGATAVNTATGAPLWTVKYDWSVLAADPAGGRFYVKQPDGALVAVNAATGKAVWTAKGVIANPEYSVKLAVDAERLYVVREDHVLALRASDGGKAWDVKVDTELGRPTEAGGVLYVPAAHDSMSLLNPVNGEDLGFDPMYPAVVDHAVIADGRLYVTTGRLLDLFSLR
jgi:outer membrane protein assembly factor BamB